MAFLRCGARSGTESIHRIFVHGKAAAFYLSLAYDGQTTVNGSYRLPAIGFDFADEESAALREHIKAQVTSHSFQAPVRSARPWWHTPIFCGWGAQSYLAFSRGGQAQSYARQDAYDDFLFTLEAREVNPGIVVLDDKWQSTYGENRADGQKWLDLPNFVTRQHAHGRKVLLWLKAWDPEGLPVEECIANAAGLPIACDPSNPAYERRLRMMVRRMLSPSGYDADGFKIDFTARIPCGPGLKIHGDTWGLELMRTYLAILHSEAKRIKPDALIMTHTPHPYLADVVDMIRLNDINIGHDVNKAMLQRAQVAAIACPSLSIDTDNWPMPNRAAWRAYMPRQPELGVPSLYYASHIDATGELLEPEDYDLIRESWRRYRERNYPMVIENLHTGREELSELSVQPSFLPAEG